MFYLSDILGHAVFDGANRKVGVLRDMAAYIGPNYPAITKIRVQTRSHFFSKGRFQFVSWSEVLGMEGPNLILKGSLPNEEVVLRQRELLLWKNVLDKQMVDVSGRKIVRVNDVAMGTIGRTARVTGVAIGGAAVLRRLGFLRFARLLPVWRLRDTIVPWESVVPLDYTATNVQLNVQMERLAKLHTADLAQILSEMSNSERSMVFDSLDDDMVADIIEEFEPREQAQLLEAIEEERVPDVVAAMEPDDAADMLQELSPEETANILDRMEEEEAEDVKELMEHERDSAGGIMTSDYVAVLVSLTAGKALEELRASAGDLPAENTFTIFAVDNAGALCGVTNLRDLVVAAPDALLSSIIQPEPVYVLAEDDAGDAARLVAKYDLLALPVVDEGVLAGIITVDDALDRLLPPDWREHLPREH
jgi:CBS domain-containing protein/sporulation protein YlmC with PRC-barrel domain